LVLNASILRIYPPCPTTHSIYSPALTLSKVRVTITVWVRGSKDINSNVKPVSRIAPSPIFPRVGIISLESSRRKCSILTKECPRIMIRVPARFSNYTSLSARTTHQFPHSPGLIGVRSPLLWRKTSGPLPFIMSFIPPKKPRCLCPGAPRPRGPSFGQTNWRGGISRNRTVIM
jgi:hypothetical protein